jgi:hypothetical protein
METIEQNNKHKHCCGGKKFRIGWIFLGIIGFTAFAFLFGAAVMWLWNGLMPTIFHLGVITYWQAVGLAVLGRLLFGSFHHGPRSHGKHGFGPWKNKGQMHGNTCRDYGHGSKWGYYDQYWNEEGEQAFHDYLKRKGDSVVNE